MLKQFFKFAGVGAIATIAQYLVLIVLTESGLANPVAASTLGYLLSGILNYALNYRFTFASKERHTAAATRFILVSGLGLALNTSLIYAGIHALGLYYLVSQVLATSVVLFWNFFINRIWTFRAIHPQA